MRDSRVSSFGKKRTQFSLVSRLQAAGEDSVLSDKASIRQRALQGVARSRRRKKGISHVKTAAVCGGQK